MISKAAQVLTGSELAVFFQRGTKDSCVYANRTGEGPKPHPHDSTLGESSREAQSGRRLLGTNGASLWLWCCLAQPGALGP